MGRTVRRVAGIAAIVIIVAVGAYLWLCAAQDGARSVRAAPPAPRPVPVTTGSVEAKEFPIYRVGIGTVQAYNTVTVKVRVDGEVQKIAFREGQDVRPGDVLAVIDPRPLEAQLRQAQADKAHDEALLTNARLDLTRYSALATHDYATRQSVDTQNALVAQYRAAIEHDEAVIDNARVQLGYTTIVAPLAGRTGLRLIDQGNIVHAADATGLVVITQIKPIAVVFTLPQQDLPEITDALRSDSLEVLAYDQDNRLLLGKGQLELIDNRVEQSTGSVKLKAVFPNDDERLWPGAFVNAWLRIAVRRGPVVPTAAVQAGPEGGYAFVIRPDTSVELRPVRVAAAWQGEALIDSGLLAGDRVVVDGQYKLRPGTHVVETPKGDGRKTAEAKPREVTP